jgi:hypothetical protein
MMRWASALSIYDFRHISLQLRENGADTIYDMSDHYQFDLFVS